MHADWQREVSCRALKEAVGKSRRLPQYIGLLIRLPEPSQASQRRARRPLSLCNLDILQMVHEIVSRKAVVKLQKAIIENFRKTDAGSPDADLTIALRYCFETYGVSGGSKGESKKRKLTTQKNTEE